MRTATASPPPWTSAPPYRETICWNRLTWDGFDVWLTALRDEGCEVVPSGAVDEAVQEGERRIAELEAEVESLKELAAAIESGGGVGDDIDGAAEVAFRTHYPTGAWDSYPEGLGGKEVWRKVARVARQYDAERQGGLHISTNHPDEEQPLTLEQLRNSYVTTTGLVGTVPKIQVCVGKVGASDRYEWCPDCVKALTAEDESR